MVQQIFNTTLPELFEERTPWTHKQCDFWANQQQIVKPYPPLIDRIKSAAINLHRKGAPISLDTYGQILAYNQQYDLTKTVIGDLNNGKDSIILTGGVHGYEPSGEESCIRFVEKLETKLLDQFNFIVYPCITPSAYVINHRWNNFANDQNRAFDPSLLQSTNPKDTERNQEAVLFMQDITKIKEKGVRITSSIDLHETPIKDIELRIARSERYGTKLSKEFRKLPDASYFYIGEETQIIENRIVIPTFATAVSNAMGHVVPMAQDDFIIGSKNHGNGIAISGTKNTLRHFMAQTMSDNNGISITTEVCPESIPEAIKQRTDIAIEAQLATTHSIIRHLSL